MKNFYIGFSRARSPFAVFSALIRWAEYSKTLNPKTWFNLFFASHCFTLYPRTDRRPFYMVNEAAGAAVRFMSQPHFEEHSVILKIYKVSLPEHIYDQMKTEGEYWAGLPYALFENLGIVFVRLAQFVGVNVKNPFGRGTGAMKCSEMILLNTILRIPGISEAELRTYVRLDFRLELPREMDTFGVRDLFYICESLMRRKIIERGNLWEL